MTLSSNSIIHFTNSKDALKGILSDNFRLSYCTESINLVGPPIQFSVPMVSFCDIPLSKVKDHISKYGAYGIGLTKQWAERKKLNLVLYIEKESNLAYSYLKVYNKYISKSGKQLLQLEDEEKAIIDILRYIKNYQNDLTRGGMVYPDYRFSDEREWRYVLDYQQPPQFIYAIQDFDKTTANNSLTNHKLEFEPNDIKYVIIENESEISEFVEVLRNTKGKKYSYQDVERVMTRIITTEQIVQDF